MLITTKNFFIEKGSTVMNTITYSQRYFPHELSTKFNAVKLFVAVKVEKRDVNPALHRLRG